MNARQTPSPPLTKAEKRAAAKKAAARAAATRRRRQLLIRALVGLAVVGVAVALFVTFRDSGEQSAGAKSCPGAFPTLPEGGDPALCTKPATSAGTGEVTKLTVTPLVEGKGAAAEAGQRITVNYVGVSYKSGAEFDASWKRSEPLTFELGGGNVIKGWDEGLVGIKVGTRVQLDIPSEMAYGDNPGGGRPGGPLRFIVDVLAVE